jgi:hypothetical protein
MRPWERRLADLAHLLKVCHATYMEPDLFRMNTNQFLQTSRTVTFIVQKNKASIPNFAQWYQSTVIDPWRKDTVMIWARDARNSIEKEGDLELNSKLNLTLLFSYLSETDIRIGCGRSELLVAGIKKLVRLAQKKLPTGVGDAAIVKIERRWVTASLASMELLQALTYIYARLYDMCLDLATKLSGVLASNIPDASEFDSFRDRAQQIVYIKIANLRVHSLAFESSAVQRDDEVQPALRQKLTEIIATSPRDATFDGTCLFLARMAEMTFTHFGNHVPMLFLYDEHWVPIDMISTWFADQADKYIFWRRAADRVATQRAHGIGWISESWVRTLSTYPETAIRNLPITGERLHVLVADRAGTIREVAWSIIRETADAAPTLLKLSDEEMDARVPNYLLPIRRVWGLADPDVIF